ncbi:hypothetical protein SAMN05216350_102192 [Polaromonas sp. YR568]|uniref:hypothetical protein n=1 Tax=Polaromonas sp. YR568 TaxID=1855301 RepID=UPI0008EE11A3|nr:hypothetical protein [Polaromonas sp. YR568]SFU49620.1 hypothetical protein SAMN05216350_102192 [Polaromonas sp. YR568]
MHFSWAGGIPFSRGRMGLAALFLAGVACSSHAQFGGGSGGGPRQRGGQGHTQAGAPASQRSQTAWEQLSGKLYDLRIQLMITREQGQAWEAFRASLLETATTGPSGQAMQDQPTAKDAFQQLLRDAQRRTAALTTLDTAAQALLAQLSPEQLQTADKALPALLAELGGNRPR